MTNNIKYSDVQNAFKEGATPNEDDYQKLITLARVGGLALGATDAAPTNLSPGVGLEIKDNKLAVKAAEKQGLSVSANGVGVEADMTSVAVTGDGLEVILKKDGGLSKEGGLHVVAGPGLKTDGKGLQIALAQNSGLATTGGLAVAADGKAGLEINKENKLAVRLSQKNKFLEAKDDGLAINDDGIQSIRDTLKAVSIEALNQAIVGTNHGFMKDIYKPEAGSVEAQIATALNDAYKNGLCPDAARYALEMELRNFVGDKSQFVGLVATSPNNDDVGLYDTTGNQFSKGAIACFFIDADGVVKMPDIDGANISQNASGAYTFVGRVNDKGVQDKDGKYYTTNALMVIVGPVRGGHGFAGCIGAWNLEELKANRDSWSNTPAPDPLLWKRGYEKGKEEGEKISESAKKVIRDNAYAEGYNSGKSAAENYWKNTYFKIFTFNAGTPKFQVMKNSYGNVSHLAVDSRLWEFNDGYAIYPSDTSTRDVIKIIGELLQRQ